MALSDRFSRLFGKLSAAAGLILLLPFLLVLTLLVRMGSAGPVLFHQRRVGLNGALFTILKFRTMRHGIQGPSITSGRDPRITKIGRLLRDLKLDELPQLMNVLKGEMTLVGPRPEVPRYVALYPARQRDKILTVRPGMTDLASLLYLDEGQQLQESGDPERHYVEVLLPAKLRLAEAYVDNRSWWLDFRILLATLTGILGWRWMPACPATRRSNGS